MIRPSRALPQIVAVLGASAGGLEPLRELVAALPADPRLTCIVAQHIAAAQPTALVRLLQSVSSLPVETLTDGAALRGGTIGVVPPGHHAEIDTEHQVRLLPSTNGQGPAPSLDRLLASAARTLGPRVVAIVLSGTGQDGAVGARVVREMGGAVWAESPTEAPFASMPQTVVERGLADHVDTAVALGRRLGRLLAARQAARPRTPPPTDATLGSEKEAFGVLLARLSDGTGLDLRQYQDATLRRQIERVMRQQGLTTLAQLLDALERDPQLLQALQQSVTIGVTEWLRNPSAFAALRVAWREYIRQRAAAGATQLRLWSVGCSSGEEVYGLAMLTDELLRELDLTLDWMVLGTDVNAAALDQARSGVFDEASAQHLPAAWRERHFSRIGHTLRVNQELRRHCLFARHDVLQDLPFLRMDLVACRNVLIYLKGAAKDEVLRRLHHALLPDGLLMLGRSEALTAATRSLFASVSIQEHVWRKRGDGGTAPPSPPARARRAASRAPEASGRTVLPQLRPVDRLEGDLRERLLQHLVQRHAPPTVLTDRDGHPLHVVGTMDALMHWPAGPTIELTLANLVPAAWRRDVMLAQHRLLEGQEASLRIPLPPLPEQPARVLEGTHLQVGGASYLIVSFSPCAATTATPRWQRWARTKPSACSKSGSSRWSMPWSIASVSCSNSTRPSASPPKSWKPPTRNWRRRTRSLKPPMRSCAHSMKNSTARCANSSNSTSCCTRCKRVPAPPCWCWTTSAACCASTRPPRICWACASRNWECPGNSTSGASPGRRSWSPTSCRHDRALARWPGAATVAAVATGHALAHARRAHGLRDRPDRPDGAAPRRTSPAGAASAPERPDRRPA